MDPNIYTVKAVLILDNDGERLLAKYYDDECFSTVKEQRRFEEKIFEKTKNNDNEILLLENMTVVYKSNVDLMFFVVGSSDENELLLAQVLENFYDCVSDILRKSVEKSDLLADYNTVLLALDTMIDGGIILEVEADTVLDRLPNRAPDLSQLTSSKNMKNIGDMTAGQLFASAKSMLNANLK